MNFRSRDPNFRSRVSNFRLAAVTDPLREQVRQVAIARLGKSSPKLEQLGFTPAKKRKIPVAEKALAQSKAKGTRAARNGKGSASTGATSQSGAVKTST